MEKGEAENFKNRMLLAICWAGSDRSQYIADELNKRGYAASAGGILPNYNYVTEEDLVGIGSIIFASRYEKEEFKKNKRLNKFVKRNNINVYVMNITESDKDRAKNTDSEDELKKRIAKELDGLGFKSIKNNFTVPPAQRGRG